MLHISPHHYSLISAVNIQTFLSHSALSAPVFTLPRPEPSQQFHQNLQISGAVWGPELSMGEGNIETSSLLILGCAELRILENVQSYFEVN